MNNKLISFAAAAATLFAMSACNKDANQIDVVTPGTGTYAKVSISMGTPGTRATAGVGEDEFDAGTDAERKVNSVMLVLYGEEEQVVGYGSTEKSTGPGSSTEADVSDSYEKVIELTMQGKKEEAKTVVAYINVANPILPFGEAMEETTDVIEENGFIMTNSAFGNHASWSVATEINAKSLYSSPEAAVAGDEKTTIYVERLAAKVKVEVAATANTVADIDIVGVDGKKYDLKFNAANAVWAPTGTAPKMYKLKNQWTETLAWTTGGTNRNFWAKGYYYGLIDEKPDFTGILKYVSSNALRKTGADKKGIAMGDAGYTTEHTYGNAVVTHEDYNALGAATSAIVLGQYQVTTEDEDGDVTQFRIDNDEEKDFDFYLLLNKVSDKEYYTIFNEGQLVDYLFNAQNPGLPELYVDEDGQTKFVASEYYTVKWDANENENGGKKQYVLEGSHPTLYTEDGEPYSGDIVTSKGTNARHYNLGYAYFFAPIEHLGEEGKVGQYGVVRNHSYQLTVNKINGLGAPLDDDHFGTDPNNPDPDPDDPGDKPIIPDPDETALIKAELRVLSWHVVTQGVDL